MTIYRTPGKVYRAAGVAYRGATITGVDLAIVMQGVGKLTSDVNVGTPIQAVNLAVTMQSVGVLVASTFLTPATGPGPTGVPSTSAYQTVITDAFGTPIDEIVAMNLEYSFVTNEAGSCSFAYPVRDSKATRNLLDPGKRQVLIYRLGELVWGGWLWAVNASDEQDLRVSADSWFSRLHRRTVTHTLQYTQVDQFDIAWNLISYTQGKPYGDMGIVRASPNSKSGILRDRQYFGYDRSIIAEDLVNLAEVQRGFDFEITPDKLWKTYYPKKGSRTNFTFELGKNVGGISYTHDAADTTTEMSAMGSGTDVNMLTAVANNAAALAEFGLLQDTTFFRTVKNQENLVDHAEEELRIRLGAKLQPELSAITDDPPFGSYTVGDECMVRADLGYIQLAQYFRIISITVAVSNEGRDVVTVFFDQVIT